jgi:hypothetical protein
MNKEEAIAGIYLAHLGFSDIQHEPTKNSTPDFLLDNSIAVEVRRLNKYFTNSASTAIPLEELEYSLKGRLKNLFKQYDQVPTSNSVFISIKYERPLKISKELLRKVKDALDNHLLNIQEVKTIKLHHNLSLRFHPADKRHTSTFLMGSSKDINFTGPTVATLYEHIQMAVKEKEERVSKAYNNYHTWWLVLVDKIAFDVDDIDLQQINLLPPIKTIFDKIILVSSTDHTWGAEIKIESVKHT